jgi:hypothetical protein
MGRACSTHGEVWNVYKILIGKPDGKRPFEKRRKWEDNIKMDSKIVSEDVDLIHVAQDKDQWRGLVNMAMDLPFP